MLCRLWQWKLLSDHRAVTSSRPGKQLLHTMENSTDSMSEKDYKVLVDQCLEMCSALKDKGCKFSLSLRLGSSFNFSLSSEGCSPEATQRPKRRSPCFLKRQNLRRAAFLQRKQASKAEKLPLADEATSTGHDNKVCMQGGADFLDKKIASSRQTAAVEDKTVDKDRPLDLNPNPSYPRASIGSVESDSSEEDTVFYQHLFRTKYCASKLTVDSGGYPVGNSRQGSNCEVCQQTIVDKEWRRFPAQCEKCLPRMYARNNRYPVV